MKKILIGKSGIAGLLAAAAVILAVVPASGQEIVESERKGFGFFIGVHMTRFSLSGDFDGITLIIPGETEAFITPSMKSKNVVGFSLGVGTGRGGRDRFFVELRHFETTPEALYQGEKADVKSSVWSLGVRYMYTEWFIQPYIRAGFSYGRLRVVEGAISSDGTFGDAVFTGGGLAVGLGAAIWLPPCFSIFAEGGFDSMDYRNVKGPAGDNWNLMSISGTGLGGGGLTFAVGLQLMY
ncbi:MAG: hypothetical protein NTZ26_13915 [Candidatus Aminicenantes bacterium]|nr:hypothetical protein [Candidatus Aminicenantes bacterium]